MFLFFNSNKGFDITDESFYLLKIIHTDAYSDTLSFFGYYLSYLFRLCGNDIVIYFTVERKEQLNVWHKEIKTA